MRRVALADLIPAPYNPRSISTEARAGLAASLDRFGLVQPIVWNARSGHVCGGHQRLDVLRERGVTHTDVVVVDLDDTQERQLNVALNSGAISGEFTPDLQGLLDELRLADAPTFDALRFEELILPAPVVIEEAEDEETTPDAGGEPTAQPGDLWLLTHPESPLVHRVYCGDATNPDHVRLACGPLAPWIMVTDPPYGVKYDPAWRDEAGKSGAMERRTNSNTRAGVVANDDRLDWTDAYSLFTGDVAYIWQGQLQIGPNQTSLAECGFDVRTLVVWRKPHFAIGRGHYHHQMESAWYAVRRGASARWGGDRTQSTVWDIAPPKGRDGETTHGTQKPVECMMRPIANHGARGDVVYDPFLGSGTTIVAAHKVGRTCVGLELDPRYVDVIVARWAKQGGTAEREE